MEPRRGAYRMDFGLDEKVVVRDAELAYCPDCGEESVGIERADDLTNAVTQAVAIKKGRLTPKEIAFLRKQLDMNQAEFARYATVDPATVSRWENTENPQAMGPVPERLLRLSALYSTKLGQLPKVESDPKTKPVPAHLELKNSGGIWGEAA
jgi:putative zinc finger/helix-turn-helix YgiT family protein